MCEENQADSDSFHSIGTTISDYHVEKQFQEVYTSEKFKDFQEEMRQKLYCYPSLLTLFGSISTYEVADHVRVSDHRRDIIPLFVLTKWSQIFNVYINY